MLSKTRKVDKKNKNNTPWAVHAYTQRKSQMGVWSNMQYLAGNHTIERIGFYITVLYSSWVIEFRRISAWLWFCVRGHGSHPVSPAHGSIGSIHLSHLSLCVSLSLFLSSLISLLLWLSLCLGEEEDGRRRNLRNKMGL